MTQDELHAALAAKLVLLVDRALVYTGRDICGNGHVLMRLGNGTWAHDAAVPLALGCGGAFDHQPEPKPLTKLEVLLAVVAALGEEHMLGMSLSRLTTDDGTLYWAVRVRLRLAEHRAQGADLGTVLAEAWNAALDEGVANASVSD